MKNVAKLVGRVSFWLLWPIMFLLVLRSQRTRVLLCHGQDVLVVKAWYGAGQWSLPGGGLHKYEDPLQGAIREVQEEVGISLDSKMVRKLWKRNIRNSQGFYYTAHAFTAELTKKPRTTPQQLEISDITWMPWQELIASKHVSATAKLIASSFFKQ